MFRKALRDNGIFLYPYFLTALVLTFMHLILTKSELHLWINTFHSGFFDWFFRIITYAGDGIFVVLVSLSFIIFSLRQATFLMAAYLSTGLFTQILKRAFFSEVLRPFAFFHGSESVHWIDGVKMLSSRSFPSGHASSAFAMFLCLALMTNNRFIKLLCFAGACLVGFSRVYLSQHFLSDVLAGSFIGCLGAFALYPIFYRTNQKWHNLSASNLLPHDRR
jgi:membrane-associated phospholipid phosphatase